LSYGNGIPGDGNGNFRLQWGIGETNNVEKKGKVVDPSLKKKRGGTSCAEAGQGQPKKISWRRR